MIPAETDGPDHVTTADATDDPADLEPWTGPVATADQLDPPSADDIAVPPESEQFPTAEGE